MAEKNKKSPSLPLSIQRAIDSSSTNKEEISLFLSKVNFKNFDDAIALRNMTKVIEASSKVRSERASRRTAGQSIFSVNTEYDVLVTDDSLSKKLISIVRDVRSLQEANIINIQSSFVKNKYDAVKNILDSNELLVNEVDEVLTIVSQSLTKKVKTGIYEKRSILNEILKNHSDSEIEEILLARKESKKVAS